MGAALTRRWPRPRAVPRPVMAVGLPMILIATVLLADALEGPKTAFVGVLVAAPMLSAVSGGPRTVVAVGTVALFCAAVFGVLSEDGWVVAQATRLVVIGLFTGIAALGAAERVRSETRLEQADRVVAAVTQAIIRPLPHRLGGVGLASRYIGADAEAHVGGDFYEVLDTGYGVRVLVGDVRGKGLSAVRMANYVLGAFRASARREPSLEAVVQALDLIVQTEGGAEDFVTALVLEVQDGAVHGVSCGHPQPIVVDDLPPRESELPVDVPLGLGAGTVAAAAMVGLPSGLLLHSDGLTEARRPGGPFIDPYAVLRELSGARGEQLLTGVVDAVRAHVGGALRDDVALLWLDLSGVGAAVGPGHRESEPGSLRTAPEPRRPAAR